MNVVKHARARHVQVSLWRDQEQLYIGIYDDGVGFNVTDTSSRWGRKDGGFGLFSIRESPQGLWRTIRCQINPLWHYSNSECTFAKRIMHHAC